MLRWMRGFRHNSCPFPDSSLFVNVSQCGEGAPQMFAAALSALLQALLSEQLP